ncbi:hypothetical protein F4775DRAFT_599977 [Biscogniauxia sp. FL1348]|nr:hypothetical protein F4775DRAFT_599977 [Biscogniauxia sp. FL1348]
MDSHCSSDACQACQQDWVTCELSMTGPGPAIPAGCIECSNAGEGCAIPVIDNVMINNGIPTKLVCVIPPRVEEFVAEESLEATSFNYDMPNNEGFQPLFSQDASEYLSYPEPDTYEQLAENLFYQPELTVPDVQAEIPQPSATEFYLEELSMMSHGDTTSQLDLPSLEEEMDVFVSRLPFDSQLISQDDGSVALPSPLLSPAPNSALFTQMSWDISALNQ